MREGMNMSVSGSAKIGRGWDEEFPMRGTVWVIHERSGRVIDRRVIHNLVVTAGKNEAAKLLVGDGGTPFSYIALGTGTTTPSVTDTALEAEIVDSGLARAQGTVSTTDNIAKVEKTFNVTGTKAVTEAGLFNAATAGVMFARVVFAPLNVQNGDTLTYRWEITCG